MCKDKEIKKAKKQGLFRSFLYKDYYAQELRFNLRGNERIPSRCGQCLSLFIRIFILTFIVERILAWHSFDRFKIASFD